MGRLAIVVVEPASELREDGFGIAELGPEDVVAFERVDEGLGEPIALGAIGRGGDGHEAEGVRVEHGGRRRVPGAVITEPLDRVRGG
jgi:hypothetical protein